MRRFPKPLLAVFLLAVSAGCSSSPNSGDDSDSAASGGTDATSSGSAPTSGSGGAGAGSSVGSGGVGGQVSTFEASMGPFPVESGFERTDCILVKLNNPEPVYVRRFRATLSAASHHMIVYRSDDILEHPEPYKCGGFSGLQTGEHAIFIAQQKEAEMTLPSEGDAPVGLMIAANQMLQIEMHYINATPGPLDAVGSLMVDTIPLSADVIESDLAFWGTKQIAIPAHGSFQTPVRFQEAFANTKTFALTTHQHHYGTRMRVWHASNASPAGEPVADGTNWADPPLELFSPSLQFPSDSGATGFAYQCEWENTSDQPVGFGESANSEMCFLWHYYYPSHGFQICIDGTCNK